MITVRMLRSRIRSAAGTIFVSCLLLALVACNTASPGGPATSDTKSATRAPGAAGPDGKFRVALLSPGPVSDGGWNQSAYDGLKVIEQKLAADVSQQQVKGSPADREQGFRDYAARGYNMVIGHGGEFMDQALSVAKEFPDTMFVVSAGNKSASNVVSVVFELGQAAYLAGAVAAQLSKTGKAGAVGGVDIPASSRMLYAFRNGAKAINPKFEVTIVHIGSWEDTAAARQQTLALIDKGADFIIHDCDAAAPGVFQAVKERNVLAFGVQKDQSPQAPDNIVMSLTSNMPEGFGILAQRIKTGQQKGEVLRFGLKDKAVGFVVNPKFKNRVTPDMEGVLNQLTKDIVEGKVNPYEGLPATQ